jgi:hypothetical protein
MTRERSWTSLHEAGVAQASSHRPEHVVERGKRRHLLRQGKDRIIAKVLNRIA